MPSPIFARVELRADRPTLLLNDEPVAPLIYGLSDCPGARWSWEEVPQRNIAEFAARGTRLFQVDVWFEQMLDTHDRLDVTLAQRQIAGVTAVAPDAAVMIRLHVNSPPAWIAANPEECVGYADTEPYDPPRHGLVRPLADDGDRPWRASFYSLVWQDWAAAKLREFCNALAQTPEGDAVFGLQIANGVYGEWHQFGFIHHDPDTGPAATTAFRAWLKSHYGTEVALALAWHDPAATFDRATAPDSPARETSALGILRDPMTQQPVIDYFTFLHEELTNVVINLAATAKAAWPRPLVTAAFFGYFYGIFGRQVAGAQLAIEPALHTPHLDCFCSPQSYETVSRQLGGTGNARGIIGVVRRAGKLWLDEMDSPTSTSGCPWLDDFKSTPADDLALHRRNVLQPITRGGGQWWYDFGPVGATPAFARMGNIGWWDTPELLTDVAALQSLVHARTTKPFLRPADILLVHDPRSFFHTVSARHQPAKFGVLPPSPGDPFTPLLTDELLAGLYQCGSVFDEALLSELATLDLTPYRLVIFATTPVITPAQREVISDRVTKDRRHLVFLAYAGWGDATRIDPALSFSLTGVPTSADYITPPSSHVQIGDAAESLTLARSLTVPTFSPTSPDCEVIGTWSNGRPSAVRRTTDQATWWTFALPPTSSSILQALAHVAGCHAVNDQVETTLVGDGLIVVHTVSGGRRILHWPGSEPFTVELPPRSTTVFDGPTGRRLLG